LFEWFTIWGCIKSVAFRERLIRWSHQKALVYNALTQRRPHEIEQTQILGLNFLKFNQRQYTTNLPFNNTTQLLQVEKMKKRTLE
jgi:hypothetical protein